MRIKRAHKYVAVDYIRKELARLPSEWRVLADSYQWIIYPDDLSTTWTGLVYEDLKIADGRSYSTTVNGWCASESCAWFCRDTPHIFLRESSVGSTLHEVGHALEELWRAPIEEFFKPECAFYPYMALNPAEYFACAFVAYFVPEQDKKHWNRHDVAKRDYALYEWFKQKERKYE